MPEADLHARRGLRDGQEQGHLLARLTPAWTSADPYLSEQLIAYIGNKRALLPFLHGVFSAPPARSAREPFLDPFAGSGAVSRLARVMGFRVAANDWEPYSFVINSCHLVLTPSDLGRPVRIPRGNRRLCWTS